MTETDSGYMSAPPFAQAEARSGRRGGWARCVSARLAQAPRATLIEWGAMAAVMALAVTLNFWNLSASGYGNLYYAAAVRSMSENWHNFFFVSYDPGGFVSVDKPPLGFWAQVASVKLLGFSGFSLLLPEALAGTLSVAVLWRLVRRAFGGVAGVLAALALAVSPISVVANRDNILEPLLTLTLLLAAWAVSRATERGVLRWLLVCAALVGLGFNIKMLEAYLIVPALALVYLVGAPQRLRTRLLHLALAGVVMLTLSFAWIVTVDMTPATQRPYVGSTTTNSELDLALGYNGIGRLLGGFAFPAPHPGRSRIHGAGFSAPPDLGAPHVGARGESVATEPPAPPPVRHAVQRKIAPLPNPAGAPGPLRLFQAALGSQVSWLLPLALIGVALTVGASLWPPALDPQQTLRRDWSAWRRRAHTQSLALWGMWLLTAGICFSFARSINAYYVAILAPALCALAGVGAAAVWSAVRPSGRAGRERGWRGATWLVAPLALLATIAEQIALLGAAPRWLPWLAPALRLGALVVALAWLALPLWDTLHVRRVRVQREPRSAGVSGPLATTFALVALATVFVTPTAWTLSSLTWGNAGGWPSAGPQYASAPPRPHPLVDQTMMRFLITHRGEDQFIVGALDSYLTAPIIVATGQPVMDMGGFNGTDPILTDQSLARLIARDQVHLFLLPAANVTPQQRALLFGAPPLPALRGAARTHNSGVSVKSAALATSRTAYTNSLTRWVSLHCTPVPPIQWSSASYAAHRLGAWELFSCQS